MSDIAQAVGQFFLWLFDRLGGVIVWLLSSILDWVGGFAYRGWDGAAMLWFPSQVASKLTSPQGHALLPILCALGALLWLRLWAGGMKRKQAERKAAATKRSPLRDGKPGRIPFIDRPQRPLRISKDVTIALDYEHGCAVGGTRSGKSSTMAGLIDGQQSTIGVFFDISLPCIRQARRLQRQVAAGKLRVKGVKVTIPVMVWRPRDPTVKLRLLEGSCEEVVDTLLDAFARTAADTGHQRGIVYRQGVAILQAMDKRHEVRTLAGVAWALDKVAHTKGGDAQTRLACFNWSNKILSLKAMFGDAEGEGFDPAEILERGGSLFIELNTFASPSASAALAGFFMRVVSRAVDQVRVPVNVLLDESGQLGARAGDLSVLLRASGARGGRIWLCTQDPTDLLSVLSTNIGVWVLFGVGAGASKALDWMSKTTHGMRRPEEFIMMRRTLYNRIVHRLGMGRGKMHRQCDVIYEGSLVATTVEAPTYKMLKRDLLFEDWPENRPRVAVAAGLTTPDPNEPTTPPDPPDGRYVDDSDVDDLEALAYGSAAFRALDRVPVGTGPAAIVSESSGGQSSGFVRNGTAEGRDRDETGEQGEEANEEIEERARRDAIRIRRELEAEANRERDQERSGPRPAAGHMSPDPVERAVEYAVTEAEVRRRGAKGGDQQGGPSPWPFINAVPRRAAIWLDMGKPTTKDECWLVAETAVNGYGRANVSYSGPEGGAGGKISYKAFYQWAGEPNGPVTPIKKEMGHLCHDRDVTCPGGRDCSHLRCVNPWHLKPMSTKENAAARSQHQAEHQVWLDSQQLRIVAPPPVQRTERVVRLEPPVAVPKRRAGAGRQ